MQDDEATGAWKVWCYAAIAVVLGAWLSPGLFHAGKALAEVSAGRTTNGLFDWLADWCRKAGFPVFFAASVLVVAMIGFFPWLECLHWRRGVRRVGFQRWGFSRPVRIPKIREWRDLNGPWQGLLGCLVMFASLVSAGTVFAGRDALQVKWGALPGSLVMAWGMEGFFRGLVFGVFSREMRPMAALAASALFFAVVMSLLPPRGMAWVDPEAAGPGFATLRGWLLGFGNWRNTVTGFLPLLGLGLVLGYARKRSGSLWLPVGMHAAWLFCKTSSAGTGVIAEGLVPILALIPSVFLLKSMVPARHEEPARHL